jgi:PAS domain S-box-containing protein
MAQKPTYEELVKKIKKLEKEAKDSSWGRKFLRENEEHYHRLLEYNPAAIVIHDGKNIVYMNATGLDFLGGTDKEDMIGKPVLDFIHPDSRKTAIERMSKIHKDERYGASIRTKLLRLDGKSVEAMVRGIPAEFNGKPAVYAVFMDISKQVQAEEELRQSEEKYRNIFENMPISIILINRDGQIVDISPYHLNNIAKGEIPKENFIGKNILTHPTFINACLSEYYKRLLEGEPFTINDVHSPTTLPVPDGYFNVKGMPLFKEGEVTGAVIMHEDITKRRQMEKELLKAKKLESLGTLAGGIAHDFNNMMTVVLGNISLAKNETKPNSMAFELLTEAEKASLRTNELTARLITFSKGGEPVKRTIDIGRFLNDFAISALYEYDIDCEFTVPSDIRSVEIDESQMKQVILNVITNSVEAMAGQGMIKLSCENIDIGEKDHLTLKHGKYVKISIKDQGPGITDEKIPNIFDPYFSTKKMGLSKGMGLGLAVCHSIVEKHDGLITVESELGAGTTFFIFLPVSTAKPEDLCPKRNHVDAQSTINKRISTIKKVLVMDDEEMIRDVAGLMLSRLGYGTEFAKDGVEAIALYKKAKESGKPFDAVILDLTNQFGMGGNEAIEKLLEIDPDVKAIISSGYSSDPIMANFRQYGFSGAMAKPYTSKELSYILHEVLKRE